MTRTVAPGPRTGAVQIPASKSQAHRMLICAALSEAPSRLVLDGFSADIEATVQCLEALGAQLRKNRGLGFDHAARITPRKCKAGRGRKRVDAAVSAAGARCARRSGGDSDAWAAAGAPLVPAVGGSGGAWNAAAAGRDRSAHGRAAVRGGLFPARRCFLAVYFRAFICAAASGRKQHADGHGNASIGTIRRHDGAGACGGRHSHEKSTDRSGRSAAGSAMPRLPCRWSRATGRTQRFSCAWVRCQRQA